MAAAMTGFSEKALSAANVPYEKIYVHPANHAGYYPGAEQMSLKLLFAPSDGKILGAQVAGRSGVDKRIDVLAVAIQAGMTVYDLEEMELAYAPQFGSAKDPVNMAGFVAAGVLEDLQPIAHFDQTQDNEDKFLVDVRSPEEFARGNVPGAVNIPIEQLRERLEELPRDQPILAYCQVGQRGYLATRILAQRGFNVANLSGGYTTYKQVMAAREQKYTEDDMDKETLIKKLNEDLAGELSAIIQYLTYAAKATGPYRPQLAEFFLAEVPDEQGHAQFLANKIVALGGEPTTVPRPVAEAHSNHEMLEAILKAEKKATADYTQRAKDADAFGDKGLAVQLEDMVRDESGHAEETERILRDWPLK
jgi:rhodanese-related sulfurtransferase/bacterioferritin (cytochrome b1)